ncbi:putative pyridoxal phosphate-dependent aminotransferase EpsN [Caloramator mitchellensis]|uniref:Putative pyridoxal phosphate-dependent aminotransferase EpsN n=1 Tax=Caloramator mitchellensis TaxID=908809 RepID=A0A0R3JV22_CALMK|nr:DegT/DnrJ/EryC1/StrS family aminotransferase [Caloramator mitchellensis]KRQ87435.1 putative pyridoxal phosphate-dependent aminotransferase EpsN [Caloramator mitchellensis]
MKVQLAKPDITQREIDAVVEVMKSGILSIGPKIEEFERKIADYTGVKYAVAVNSGTSALNLIVKALGIGNGDEVITTPYSFVASVNCFIMEGAKPVFVDIDPKTFNMNIEEIESKITPKTKAILAVDVFGQPINMKRLREIADKHNLYLIEDSCEALGSVYDGVRAGSLADAAAFAFYPNKQITTGEGGIIVTNNQKVAEIAQSLRSQGRAITGFWLHHERLGYNYRMSEINAVLGSVQMDRLDEIIQKRLKVAKRYDEILSKIDGVEVPYIDPKVDVMSYFVYVVQLARDIDRDKVMEYLKQNGIGCRPYFTPIHVQPYMVEMFGYKEEDYPITADAGRRCVALPFYNDLSDEEANYVAEKLQEAVRICKR